jgi:hypothetical protein
VTGDLSAFDRASPFLLSIGILFTGPVIGHFAKRRVRIDASNWLLNDAPTAEQRIYLLSRLFRTASFWSDATQGVALVAPAALGAINGNATGNGVAQLVYAVVVLGAIVAPLAFALGSEPHKYTSRIGDKTGLTPVLLVALVLNALAIAAIFAFV